MIKLLDGSDSAAGLQIRHRHAIDTSRTSDVVNLLDDSNPESQLVKSMRSDASQQAFTTRSKKRDRADVRPIYPEGDKLVGPLN